MVNLLNPSEDILCYISPTGSTISVNDFKYYSKTQQDRCQPVYKNQAKIIESKPKTRAEISDPYINIPISERLKLAKVVDLRDNHTIEHLPNGMIKVIPIDKTKTY